MNSDSKMTSPIMKGAQLGYKSSSLQTLTVEYNVSLTVSDLLQTLLMGYGNITEHHRLPKGFFIIIITVHILSISFSKE